MIKKLRRKLIAACMISLAVVLTVILGGVNVMSYYKVVSDADAILSLLDANGGAFPRTHGGQTEQPIFRRTVRREERRTRLASAVCPRKLHMSPVSSLYDWGRTVRYFKSTRGRSPQ